MCACTFMNMTACSGDPEPMNSDPARYSTRRGALCIWLFIAGINVKGLSFGLEWIQIWNSNRSFDRPMKRLD